MPHTKQFPSDLPSDLFSRRLQVLTDALPAGVLAGGRRGIEKESLRVTAQGRLAATPHPRRLGAALTHTLLTTDYSEALLEIITPAETTAAGALDKLDSLHRFVHAEIGDEYLWAASMPCELPPEDDIPIAWYGTSNAGRLKHVYRRGLALRYGRAMQCIAGIHYNFSFDERLWSTLQAAAGSQVSAADFQSAGYMALIRNFRRYSWLLLYLFGASPALNASFVAGRAHRLERFDADTLFQPYATSLRMSDLGYQASPAQGAMLPGYDTLDQYVGALALAVSQPDPHYEAIGTHRDGEWVQINTNVLQIENEFYSTIRPKRVAAPGERPLHALATRGVQYVEVRCLDLNPFEPVGIALEDARFIDAFLLFCALESSADLSAAEQAEANANFLATAKEGRRPELVLHERGRAIALTDWATRLLDAIALSAQALDADGGDAYMAALNAQRAKVATPALTASARVLAAMEDERMGFSQFALAQSARHAAAFRAQPLPAPEQRAYRALAEQSLAEQSRLEEAETERFDDFIAAFRGYTSPHVGA